MLNNGNLIKWAGSKSRSAAKITPFIDFNRKYIEPFCGSATFYFKNLPNDCALNDTNEALISFYKFVATSPREVWETYNQRGIYTTRKATMSRKLEYFYILITFVLTEYIERIKRASLTRRLEQK